VDQIRYAVEVDGATRSRCFLSICVSVAWSYELSTTGHATRPAARRVVFETCLYLPPFWSACATCFKHHLAIRDRKTTRLRNGTFLCDQVVMRCHDPRPA
jgi:hypothetical protein